MYGRPMTEGSPWKHIVRFAFPILCGSLLQQLYNTVDTIVVGNFSGEDELAAVGTTGTLVFLFLAVAIGFSAGNGVVVAQHFGAGRDREVRENAATGILLLLAMGYLALVDRDNGTFGHLILLELVQGVVVGFFQFFKRFVSFGLAFLIGVPIEIGDWRIF